MQKIIGFLTLVSNHLFEFIRFVKFSNLFSFNTPQKLQGKISYRYHSIEKGLINNKIRYKFGAFKIERLLNYLQLWVKNDYPISDTQFLSACSVLKRYFDLHNEKNIDIKGILSDRELKFINRYSGKIKGGTIEFNNADYFKYSTESFREFSNSRHSVRHFNGVLVDQKIIREVVKLSRNAPSVCNRQGFRVKLINNNKLVKDTLAIQGGLNTSADTVSQVLVVSVDRSIFVSSTEWYQLFIDGGIYLQNILYSLHYHQIAAVALNWSKHFIGDLKMENLLSLQPSEKIIALIAFGYPLEKFKVPQSARKSVEEIFEVIN